MARSSRRRRRRRSSAAAAPIGRVIPPSRYGPRFKESSRSSAVSSKCSSEYDTRCPRKPGLETQSLSPPGLNTRRSSVETFLWHQPISPTVLSIKPKVNLPDGEPLRWAKRRLKATRSKFASALATWRRVASSGPVSSCRQSRFHPAVASASWSMLENVCWTTRIGVSGRSVAEFRNTLRANS